MKLSVITINYNNLEGLKRTIESVEKQKCKGYSWIIIDGGSSDGSRELIEQTVKRCIQITFWCSEPDKGIYNAMNKGIEKATSDYCLFLNSGDVFYNEFVIENIIHKLDGNNINTDMIVGRVMYDRGTLSKKYDNVTFSASKLFCYSFPHQASFIRTALLSDQGGYDESYRILGDWKFFLESIIWKHSTIQFIDDVIALVDSRGISQTNRELFSAEEKRLKSEIFPNYLARDMQRAASLAEVLESNFIINKLYGLLYRIAMLLR